MADPINLNQFRKKKAKEEKKAKAKENRIRFGASKTEKITLKKQTEKQSKQLDDKKLD